jgi:hypothetical protein
LKEGVRFAVAGAAEDPARLGFLAALKPFLPHLNAQLHKDKLKVRAPQPRTAISFSLFFCF